MMEVTLEVLSDVELQRGRDIEYLTKGDIVQAKFSNFGVNLLFGNTWSMEYSYENIQKCFKVYGQ